MNNPALKLKESVIEEERKKYLTNRGLEPGGVSPGQNAESWQGNNGDSQLPDIGEKLKWQYFDEKLYVDKTRVLPGQDAYAKNKFNQVSSDQLKSNRDVPDTRNQR